MVRVRVRNVSGLEIGLGLCKVRDGIKVSNRVRDRIRLC